MSYDFERVKPRGDLRALVVAMALAAGALGLIGCGAEGGGVGGTGISASVVGTVTEVEVESSSGALTSAQAVPQLSVSLEESPGLITTTDEQGIFRLSGEFAGTVTLRFAQGARVLARLEIDVPEGSTIEIDDIVIRSSLPMGVRPGPIRQRGFVGRVRAVDCTVGAIAVEDRQRRSFVVRIDAATEIVVDGSGALASCDEIDPTDRVAVEGLVNRDKREIEATRVRLLN